MRRSNTNPQMFPHPNHLPRWLLLSLLTSGALLLVSGLLWDALHYFAGAGSDELALPHRLEHPLMQLHGLGLIGFVFALGGLAPVHVPRGWREQRNRKTGLLMIAAALFLALSGYALYYWVGEASRNWVGIAHAAVGTLMALLLAVHALWRRSKRFSSKVRSDQ